MRIKFEKPFYFFFKVSTHCVHFMIGKNKNFIKYSFYKVLDRGIK